MPISEERITDLEHSIIGMEHRMNTAENILVEIKNVLVEQNKAMTEIIKLQQRQQTIEHAVAEMRQDIIDRKEETNPFIEEGKAFMNKLKGGLLVATLVFGGVQAIVTSWINANESDIMTTKAEVATNKTEIERVEKLVDEVKHDIDAHEYLDYQNKTGPLPQKHTVTK